MSGLAVFHSVADLRAAVRSWRAKGERVALVPTMGALHVGHASLVTLAKTMAERVVVSIFVNPAQFAPNEDFSAYPRTLPQDLEKLREVAADAAFAPAGSEMYPEGFSTSVTLLGPAVAGLEDRFRPTHFAGVALVVAKLLNQCGADVALFGEKDYQQLKVITRMAADLDIPTRIIGAPTMREPDGLALSSRNVYLDAGERNTAPALHRALQACAAAIRAGVAIDKAEAEAVAAVSEVGFVVDYIEVRHADSLAKTVAGEGAPLRILAAARLGRTRLIDNIAV